MNIKAGNTQTPIVINPVKETVNIESKSTHINVNSDSAVAAIVQAVINLKQVVDNIDTTGAKENTLLQGIADLKNAFANIDLSSLETTLVSGLNEVKDAVNNIDFTNLETAIGEVKDAVANIDFSALAQEDTLTQGIQAVKDAIDAIPATDLTPVEQAVAETAKETTLNSAKDEIITAIDNAKPEIDLTEVAKETTLNSAKEEILTAVENIELPEIDTTNIASKDLERFFGVKPIEGYEFMTPEEVCSELEDIMTAMDISLTQQQAQEITNNTLNKG